MSILTVNELVSTTALHLLGAFASDFVTRSGALRSTTAAASDALASSTEKALHTVEITDILTGGLLRLALAVVNLLVLRLLLQIATVVSKASLSLTTTSVRLK